MAGSRLATDIGFDGGALGTRGAADRADAVATDGGRDNKCLSIMHDEGFKGVVGTFDNGLFAFYEIDYVKAAAAFPASVVRYDAGKPVPTSLDEFGLMKSGAFFTPTVAACNFGYLIDQTFACVVFIALPTNVCLAMANVDRARLAVEPWTIPIPELKCENEWRCADFEDHAVAARTMKRPGRDEKMIVLVCRKPRNEPLIVEWGTTSLSRLECLDEVLKIRGASCRRRYTTAPGPASSR